MSTFPLAHSNAHEGATQGPAGLSASRIAGRLSVWSDPDLTNGPLVLTEISIVVFLTLLNGVLAMSELAVVSSRPVRLKRNRCSAPTLSAVA
ncbi:hypothetical protein U2P60_21480 [Brucella sp. H1_1004]|uniref:hypothetical protein n=1 Tax=Brucella sp. H1_1004 TaxID=3110109 RepID=UPI0039B4775C